MKSPTSDSSTTYVAPVADVMLLYVPPTELARCHWYVYVVEEGGELVHEPFVVVNVAPVRAVPETTGSAVFVGAISTTAEVAADKAADDGPMLFVAVTETLMKYPTSDSSTTYVGPVSDVMLLYVPLMPARCHWYANDVGELVHEPLVVVNVAPLRALPEITGSAVFVGATSTTAVVAAEVADAEPKPFVPDTETLMKYPMSDSDTTYELLVAVAMSSYTPVDVDERFH